MQLIIRDDDTSYFTRLAQLEQIYAPLWERGLPVCLAVIPAHYGNIQVAAGDTPFTDPNIAPQYQGQEKRFPITDNPALVDFLNDLARAGLVEICLHGYDHDWMEFRTEDADIIAERLQGGRALLAEAFPDVPVNTFIAPYDGISAVALEAVIAAGYHTALHPYNVPALDGLPGTAMHQVALTGRGTKLFTGGIADYSGDIAAWLDEQAATDATVFCVNHYYMFYQDFGPLLPKPYNEWRALMALIVDRYADQVTTFSAARVP